MEDAMATKTLTITNMTPITSGVGQYGPWTLYGVDAISEDGTEITETLKTFQELPIGEQITVEIERRDHPEYGTEYQLKKPKGSRMQLRQSPVDEAYEDLRKRVYAIEQHLGLVPASVAVTDVPAPAPQPVTAAGPLVDDSEEIPFAPSVF